MKNFIILLLTLGLTAGAAEADFKVFNGAVYDVFITDPVSVGDGSESLLSVVLRVENKTGLPGFDLDVIDGTFFGYTGITGILHQHYSMIFAPPPMATATLDSTGYATAIDTHFLFVLADLLIVAAPSEDVSLAPSAEATDAAAPFDAYADTDFGAYLTGTFGFPTAPVLDLAYVVVPTNSVVTLDLFISGVKGGEHIDTSFLVPEPATLGLLSLGGLALLRKRRK